MLPLSEMTLADVGIAVAIICSLSSVAAGATAFAVRFALIPFLERRWSQPIQEIIGQVREMKAEIEVMSRAFDGHLDWSQREVDQLWSALERNHPHEKSNNRSSYDRRYRDD
jgi:hypothetical protein